MKDRPLIEVAPHRDPVCLLPSSTVQQACARMREAGSSAVLVVGPDGELCGIFTGRDAICRVLADGRDPAATPLADVMTARVETLGPKATAKEALLLLNDAGFRHLPVVEGGRVVGIVSRYDFRAKEQARLDDETGFMEMMR